MTTGPDSTARLNRPAGWWAGVRRQPAAFLMAVAFLTRVPVRQRLLERTGPPAALLRASVVYFPLVGALVGLATATVVVCSSLFWPVWLAVVLGLAAEAVLTGAFHEDAVADFCDAFGGGWTRDDVLRILKDSRVGSFGALGLMLAVAGRAGSLAALDPAVLVPAAVASACLGRWVILLVMATLPPVSDRPSLAGDVGERLSARDVAFGGLIAVPGVVAWGLIAPGRVAVAVTVLLLFALAFVAYVRRRIGGVTGDCLGCACYAGQLLVLLVASARPA
mgnify:CR=1 FL=1